LQIQNSSPVENPALGKGVVLIALQFMNAWGKGVMRGTLGKQFPGRRITIGVRNHCMGRRKGPTMSQVLSSIYTVHLLPKDLMFEHGGAKLAYFPGRHLTLFRPWHGAQNRGSRNYTWRFTFLPSKFCALR